MKAMWDLALPPVVAMVTFLMHVVVNHLVLPGPRQRSPQRVALLVSLASAVACTAVVAALRGPADLAFAAVVSGCIAYCYFHLFNMSETARRIRILTTHLLGVPVDDLSYPLEAMIDARIDRLIMLAALRQTDGCFRPTRSPLLAATIVLDWWRGVLFPGRRDEKI